ncbi:CidA/LrgA family protein [Kurthia sibirica]|uniref:Murein hydrolase regulator LrgA n=1 Tax=Kurthia sibirica TaxID=202750 RepID=A0A2U3ANB0_9BACL|nr:CidA/LrgA family protein [Kurthia sibirica]PWI25979.1 murein hydrolase regulator LrgA [Kurthia sibirica]GEK34988.1 holin-like protein CidA [Kurthia sibirica]
MNVLKIIVQIIIIYSFLLIGQWLATSSGLPIPGSIIGLLLLLLCLTLHIVPLQWVDLGARFLTGELLLFFIPAAVGIINYDNIIGIIGIKLIAVIFLSTIIVMTVTALIADRLTTEKRSISHASTKN